MKLSEIEKITSQCILYKNKYIQQKPEGEIKIKLCSVNIDLINELNDKHHFTSNLKIPKNTTYQIPLKYQY